MENSKGSADIMESMKKMVTAKGFPVHIDTVFCKKWHANGHSNCVGCESQEGCSRYTALCGIMLKPLVYKAQSFEDSLTMDRWIMKNVKKILDKNVSLEEIKEII